MAGALQGEPEEIADVGLVLGDEDVLAQGGTLMARMCDCRALVTAAGLYTSGARLRRCSLRPIPPR